MALGREINIYSYSLTIITLFVSLAASEDMMLSINLKKPIAVVSEKFLSITLDPIVLFNSNSLNDVEKTTSMAKALAPAYIRIGGPRSNSYIFERGLYPHEIHSDPGYVFSETHWIQIHQWAEKSGLDVIACITPQQSESNSNVNNARSSFWDPRNALDLISFSDHMGYNTSWQLGYECQTRCDVNGIELGRDVQRLRNMLDAFPRYAERGLIIGPDVVTYKTRQQQQYLQDYFNAASSSLSAITWHPDFASVSLENEGVSMHYDNLALDKDSFYRAVGRHLSKKPLWIAESRPEECKQQFLGALVWARRLGNSAKLGLQVLMRQPENSNLFNPTPDYWVSILHKMLVGREVLDTKITIGNRTHVHFYCQCTNPSSKYEKGSLTIFGINLTPSKIIASLKGIKLKIVHKYILLPGYDAPNRMFAETVLLNNEPLILINGKEVPDVQPAITNAEKGLKLKLPSGGIGFWVLPGLKVKSCMNHEDEIMDKNFLRKVNRRLEESEVDLESESEDENNREITDVINSVEERKPSLRLQRTTQKRLSFRRNSRHKDDERDDLDERKLRKLDGARRDFDRLEKIMRKKDHYSVNLKSGGTHRVFENSNEDENSSSEEGVFTKTINGQKLDSGEVIRAKLQEYKKRLNDYENKKRQRELISNLPKERIKDELDDSINKGMDTEKVIEALTLITKVESAMKGFEKENESEVQITSETPTLGASDSNDVTAGLQRSNSGSQRGDEVLLDEVLNSEKSKRTSIPTRIEDQLKALYRLLSEEKERRDNQSSLRRRRDLDKRLGDDPLGLRRDNIFLRKRMKTDEAKERFMERVNERKQRLRERQDLKHEIGELKKDSRDSNENNFYGFQYREPIKNFPKGDVYLQTGIDSNKRKNINYEYVNDTTTDKQLYQQQVRRNLKRSNAHTKLDKYEDTWLEEGKVNHLPNEFYENMKLQSLDKKVNLENYGELWEAEAAYKNEQNKKNSNESAESTNHEIVTENTLPDFEDSKTKEKTVQQLLNYFKTDVNNKNYNFEDLKQNQAQIMPDYQQDPILKMINKYQVEQQNKYLDTDKHYINPSAYVQDDKSLYHRTKRHTNDLEDLLRQEMITQDDNNLRDCQCRVIRGIEECKDCDIKNIFETQLIITSNQKIENPTTNYIKKNRFRRDLNEKTNIGYLEKPIDFLSQNQKLEIVNSQKQIEASKQVLSTEINIENNNETKDINESATVNIEHQLKLESDNDKKLWNRLPRKIEPCTKFLIKTGETFTTPITKVNSQNDQQNNTVTNNFTSNIYTTIGNGTETPIEHIANIRSAAIESSQDLMMAPLGKVLERNTFSKKQSSRYFGEKSSIATSETDRKSKAISKDEIIEEKGEQSLIEHTTLSPITSNSTNIQKVDNTKLKSSISKNTNFTNIDSKGKLKNNSTIKIDERIKSRQARLTTRAEALAALKKENESRRAKKMIEASMKIIDMEKSKFAEYQKRRQDQLERLKRKLRAKREKILQQYRNELLEAINESSESKETNINRRDLLDKFQTTDDRSIKNDKITDRDKFDYMMNYRPIKYTSEKDTYKSENEKHMPIFKIMEPYHEVRRRQILPKNQVKTYTDDDSSKFETNKDRKRSISLEKNLEDEDFYDASDEQEFQITNTNNSPYSMIDRDVTNENHNLKKFDDVKKIGNEYYMQRQNEQQTLKYYPDIMYNGETILPVHVQHNPQPLNRQKTQVNLYKINPSYVQEKSNERFYKTNPMNIHQTQDFNFYDTNEENIQDKYSENNHYEVNQQIRPNHHQLEQNIHQLNIPNYEEIEKELLEQNYQKSKRSDLNIFETDPTVHEDGESDYNSEELFMTPLSQLSARKYNQDPYKYKRKYKREAIRNMGEDLYEPLSFPLGLEKSKMAQKKKENSALPDNLMREKRVVNGLFNIENKTTFQKRSPLDNNIIKFHETLFHDKDYKKLTKNPRYVTLTTKFLELSTPLTNKNIYKNSNNLNEIYLNVKKFNPKNYLTDIRSKDLSIRQKRSLDQNYDYQVIESNGIDHLNDPEIDEIGKSIVETKQNEKLLVHDQQNNKMIENLKETQNDIKMHIEPITQSAEKTVESTIQTNIESILVDAIPKLQTVITGGLKKAENLTDSLEYLMDNFDNELNNTTEYLKEKTDISETKNERLNHNIFRTMVGSVKKFFGLVSGIAKIFHGY